MPLNDLPVNVDATYADDPLDASVKTHQMFHDDIHILLRKVGDIHVETGAYTFVGTDAGKTVEYNSASAGSFSIPSVATAGWVRNQWVYLCQRGAGVLTVVALAGVTLHARGDAFRLNGQWAEAMLRMTATDEWVLSGDLQV